MPRPQDNQFVIVDTISAVSQSEWDELCRQTTTQNPFLRHAFLDALETCGCANEFGWLPRHALLRDSRGTLVAAMPLYAKTNSYGEFVFDWNWAQAYEQHYQKAYNPKLVCATPYTPITAPRLLGRDNKLKRELIRHTISYAGANFSGVHWLFCTDEHLEILDNYPVLIRRDCQFHWHNNGYGDFNDFLSALKSKKRKMVKRERRIVKDSGLRCESFIGTDVPSDLWPHIATFYRNIYTDKFGVPTLNEAFFRRIGETMGDQLIVVVAFKDKDPVACAINYKDDDTLYGRHWGCSAQYHSLHFELCYYTGIDYCIKHGLKKFEPGAQGEHKIARGFVPVLTQSAHWMSNADFAQVAQRHCEKEYQAVQNYAELIRSQHNPYSTPNLC